MSYRSKDAKLKQFKNIEQNCQTVRNDMTVSQQHVHVQRTTKKRKEENIRTIAEGRGKKLKCEEFPELASYIEFAFGEGDRILRGGGLQADRRLLDTKLLKAADNATDMRHIQEMLNNIKPEFSISTSCLYTYTTIGKVRFKQSDTIMDERSMPTCHSTKLPTLPRRFIH